MLRKEAPPNEDEPRYKNLRGIFFTAFLSGRRNIAALERMQQEMYRLSDGCSR
jgi:hypothetical protein